MAESSTAVAGSSFSPPSKLEPDAIGVAQDTVIGMASSAPAATVGLTLFSLASATAYGSVPILLLTAIPMLIIANALAEGAAAVSCQLLAGGGVTRPA
jgi:hypothetical protein